MSDGPDDDAKSYTSGGREKYLVSTREAANILGINRETLARWIRDSGCPKDSVGGPGGSTLVDTGEIFAWRQRFVREEEAAKYVNQDGSAGGKPVKPADAGKLIDLKIKQIALGQKAELLVPRHVPLAAFERLAGILREAIMSLPDGLFRTMAGFPEKQKLKWREQALEKCRDSLIEAFKAITAAMPDFEPPEFRE